MLMILICKQVNMCKTSVKKKIKKSQDLDGGQVRVVSQKKVRKNMDTSGPSVSWVYS